MLLSLVCQIWSLRSAIQTLSVRDSVFRSRWGRSLRLLQRRPARTSFPNPLILRSWLREVPNIAGAGEFAGDRRPGTAVPVESSDNNIPMCLRACSLKGMILCNTELSGSISP